MTELQKKMKVTSELEKQLIFQNLMKQKSLLNVIIDGIEYQGIIEKLENDSLTLRLQSPLIGQIEESCRINFIFHNNYHYFNSSVQQVDEESLFVFMPDKINKNILRRHTRIDVYGKVYMKLKVMVRSENKEFEKSSLLNERIISQEVKKPRPSVEKILNGIKLLVSEFSQRFQVKTFKPDQEFLFEENIIKDSKKIFLIYDSYEDNIEEQRFYNDQVLTVGGAFRWLTSKGESRKVVEDKLLDLLQQRRNKRIYSECLIPMMLEGDVVGYIRLINDIDYHRSIKRSFAQKVIKYARILVEALVKYDYFSLDSGKDYDTPVINISAGGLLFKLNNPKLKKYLIEKSVLQISIRFLDRDVEAKGIIFRIDSEKSEYGVRFQEINDYDTEYIENIVKKAREVVNGA